MSIENDLKAKKGKLVASLVRNHKQIKADRALAIAENTELILKRKVEDLQVRVKELVRDRESMLDLGGTSTTSIMSAADFDVHAFVEGDLKLGLEIHNTGIKLGIAEASYRNLFTDEEESEAK